MIDSYLRSPLQRLMVDPVVEPLARKRVDPLLITAVALVTGVLILPSLYLGWTSLAIILLMTTAYLDTLDGSLARHSSKEGPLGAALDIVSDRAVEFAIIMGLFLVDPDQRALPCLLMLGSVLLCITSFLVVGIFEQNQSEKSFHYSPGIMERSEAFLAFAAMILWPGAFVPLSIGFTLLVTLTASIRIWQFATTTAR